jgi:hypothetical protein
MTEMAEVPTMWLGASRPASVGSSDDVLLALDAAVALTKNVARVKDEISVEDADRRLREAIAAARDAGVAWGTIGNRLGIARGNAYQKYRKRPS